MVFFNQIENSRSTHVCYSAGLALSTKLLHGQHMKIFITGATGFIGSHLVKMLDGSGHRLYCLVRKTSNTSYLKNLDVELVIGDVTEQNSMFEAVKKCDWIINLANRYTYWEPDKSIYRKVNVDGTRNVMECALEAGISKIVHISTLGIYGKPADFPFNEDSPVGQERFSEYFKTKYEGDLIAWEMFKTKNLPLVMIYPVAVLGPGDPKTTGQYIRRLINRQMPARVFEDKIFTFVHVKDVATAIIKAAEKENNLGEKYIIGNSRLTFGEVNRMVSEISGVALPKMCLPDFMVAINARLLTWLADLIKKPPLWMLSVDQIKVMKEGAAADGTKAEKELGITYAPIRQAIEDAIASFRQ